MFSQPLTKGLIFASSMAGGYILQYPALTMRGSLSKEKCTPRQEMITKDSLSYFVGFQTEQLSLSRIESWNESPMNEGTV